MNELAPAPVWLIEKLTSPSAAAANRNVLPSNFMSEGSRNVDLTSLAWFLKRKHKLDPDNLEACLLHVNSGMTPPLPEAEVHGIAKSVSSYPEQGPLSYDDIPLSRELATHLAPNCRSTSEVGWLTYNGKHWEPDPRGTIVQEHTKRFAEKAMEAERANSDPQGDNVKRARQVLAAPKISRITDLAASDPQLHCRIDDFDARPEMLNVKNGTLNLETSKLHPHSPGDLLTRMANAVFDPHASCPCFNDLLADCLPESHQSFVLRLFGYALLARPAEQIFAMFYGSVTCHGVFPPPSIRVRPNLRTDNEANEIYG